jgi:hypothetical protein
MSAALLAEEPSSPIGPITKQVFVAGTDRPPG